MTHEEAIEAAQKVFHEELLGTISTEDLWKVISAYLNTIGTEAVGLERINDLLDQYWQIAYEEGLDGRDHDTASGDAQECRTALERAISSIAASRLPVGGEVERLKKDADDWCKAAIAQQKLVDEWKSRAEAAESKLASLSSDRSGSGDAVRVKIKPLEWSREPPYHVARVFGNVYVVEAWDGGATVSGISGRRDFATFDEAKAAAQADYEQRIRSALFPSQRDPAPELENDSVTLRNYCQQLLDIIQNYDVEIEGEDNDLIAHISEAVDPAHAGDSDNG